MIYFNSNSSLIKKQKNWAITNQKEAAARLVMYTYHCDEDDDPGDYKHQHQASIRCTNFTNYINKYNINNNTNTNIDIDIVNFPSWLVVRIPLPFMKRFRSLLELNTCRFDSFWALPATVWFSLLWRFRISVLQFQVQRKDSIYIVDIEQLTS